MRFEIGSPQHDAILRVGTDLSEMRRAVGLVRAAAGRVGVDERQLDFAIWEYESERTGGSPHWCDTGRHATAQAVPGLFAGLLRRLCPVGSVLFPKARRHSSCALTTSPLRGQPNSAEATRSVLLPTSSRSVAKARRRFSFATRLA